MNTRTILAKDIYKKRIHISQSDTEFKRWFNRSFDVRLDDAPWDDITYQFVMSQLDDIASAPKFAGRAVADTIGLKWVRQELSKSRDPLQSEIEYTWRARSLDLIRMMSNGRTTGISQLTFTEGQLLLDWIASHIDGAPTPDPTPWTPAPLPVVEAVAPPLLDLERIPQPLFPVALLPAITFTTVEYGCEPAPLSVEIEDLFAPQFTGEENKTIHIPVRVVTVDDDFVIEFEPDDELIEAINNPAPKPAPVIIPKIVTKDTPISERSPRHILRRYIAQHEPTDIGTYTRRRYDCMGHTSLIAATNEQLGAYAVSLGYSVVALNAMFARHAFGDGRSRRLGGAA